jgi:hypothetical protein
MYHIRYDSIKRSGLRQVRWHTKKEKSIYPAAKHAHFKKRQAFYNYNSNYSLKEKEQRLSFSFLMVIYLFPPHFLFIEKAKKFNACRLQAVALHCASLHRQELFGTAPPQD